MPLTETEKIKLVSNLMIDSDPTLKKEYESMTEEERKLIHQIIQEVSADGVSPSKNKLWETDYETKPVSISTFLDDKVYMGVTCANLYPYWRVLLEDVFSEESKYLEIILTGAIGCGKTTVGIIMQLYKIYCLSCLREPPTHYGLMQHSSIAFGFMNANLGLAADVETQNVIGMMMSSEYFRDLAKITPKSKITAILNLPKNIKIGFGSMSSHILGKNLFGGLLDEINFTRSVEDKQAFQLYRDTRTRMLSRFLDEKTGKVPGLLVLASSVKDDADFLTSHIQSLPEGAPVKIVSDPLWIIKGIGLEGPKFRVMVGDRTRRPKILDEGEIPPEGSEVIEVPEIFKTSFQQDLEKSLIDIAGKGVGLSHPFFSMREKIYACMDDNMKYPFTVEEYSIPVGSDVTLESLFIVDNVVELIDVYNKRYNPRCCPMAPRCIHMDIGLVGDSFGIAMSHIGGRTLVERTLPDGSKENVMDYVIHNDFTFRIYAPGGGDEIDVGKAVGFCQYLNKLGFRIIRISFDGFQSRYARQVLTKVGFDTEEYSVDRKPDGYYLTRQAIYEGRVRMPRYYPLADELIYLQRDPKNGKVNHPPNCGCNTFKAGIIKGSHPGHKDIGDAFASSVAQCMIKEFTEHIDIMPSEVETRPEPLKSKVIREFEAEPPSLVIGDDFPDWDAFSGIKE